MKHYFYVPKNIDDKRKEFHVLYTENDKAWSDCFFDFEVYASQYVKLMNSKSSIESKIEKLRSLAI